MSAGERKMNCSEVAPLLVFLACDEVTAEERAGNRDRTSRVATIAARCWSEESALQECDCGAAANGG